jgi:hypothetical protein
VATIDQVADGSDGSRGEVHYNWAAADTRNAGAGLFIGEFETTFSSGTVETFPNDSFVLIGITGDL